MKKILLFGATGFIGKNIIKRFSKNHSYIIVGISSRDCDLRNRKEVLALCKANKDADFVINAAYKGVNSLLSYSKEYLNENLEIVENILYGCRELHSVKKVIYFGSSLEYGNDTNSISENHTLSPQNMYATAKTVTSLLSLGLARELDIPLILIRPFNLYGPYENQNVIYYLLTTLLKNKIPSLSNGEQVRDYLYIDDFTKAIYEVLANYKRFENYGIVNVGSGREIQLQDIFSISFRLFKKKKKFTLLPQRKHEYYCQVADITKISSLTSWRPTTSMEEGLRKTLAWMRQEGV